MRLYKNFICCALLICLTFGCLPIPWEAWRYEHNYIFSGQPAPWNMPKKWVFDDLYVDELFVNIRVMAHNESIYSGDPPYQIIIPLLTNNNEINSVTFHSVVISSTLGSTHVFSPINVNNAARKIENLQFPVTKKFKPYSETVTNPTPLDKQFSTSSLWSDKNLGFEPEKNEIINILIDIEVHKADSSVRKVVEYKMHPRKESGGTRWFFPT